jgi:hypothetical protein
MKRVTRLAMATAASLPEPNRGTFLVTMASRAGSSTKLVSMARFRSAKDTLPSSNTSFLITRSESVTSARPMQAAPELL